MKTNLVRMAVLVAAAVTMALPAFAGQTQAEREKVLRQEADPESSALAWQIRPAMGTGSLPVDNGKQLKSEIVARTEVPAVALGGTVYRIGIDTP